MFDNAYTRKWDWDKGSRSKVYMDFEFNRTEEKYPNQVCVSAMHKGEIVNVWLHDDKMAQRNFSLMVQNWLSHGILVSFGAIAETRCLMALGLDPYSFPIVDLWAEWRQLRNNCNKWEYGNYFDYMGQMKTSVAPHPVPAMNVGRDTTPLGDGLVAAAAAVLKVNISCQRKDAMRKLILEDRPFYSSQEREEIMLYCADDVKYLPDLYEGMALAELDLLPGWEPSRLQQAHFIRGCQSAQMAICESEGIPIDVNAAFNLSQNVEEINNQAIITLVNESYPFFEKDINGEWKQKVAAFDTFIKNKNLSGSWKKTTTGHFACDEKTLDLYLGIPEIKAFKDTQKTLHQVKWFRDEAWDYFLDHVELRTQRLRCWMNPFGTQTNRNAPPAKIFVPAMSNWLRALIRAPKGFAITGVDWSSQEFAIAAYLSGDKNMLEAYRSGDPYVYFAKRSGAIPQDAENKHIKEPEKATGKFTCEQYVYYSAVRDLFKSTVLGLQFGMGIAKLAAKLSADTHRQVSEKEARELRDSHKRIFSRYWQWKEEISIEYTKGPITLKDGWTIFCDNDSELSVQNSPVQGTGSVALRYAIAEAHYLGLHVIYPFHDAIYILHPETDTKSAELLENCMSKAVKWALGESAEIRTESKTFRWNEDWVEKKGKRMFGLFSRYLKTEKPYREREMRESKQKIRKDKENSVQIGTNNVQLELETSNKE